MKGGRTINCVGYGVRNAKDRLAPMEFRRRDLRATDVLIEIKYCGVCHSDIHKVRNEWRHSLYPLVPGHEITGVVAAVGSSARRFKIGDRVGVGCMVGSCGRCDSCKAGEENCCSAGFVGTYGSDEPYIGGNTYGGYSDKIVVDEKFALRIPKGMDMASAAPLLCAGITTYSPIMRWHVSKGQRVGVVGFGGLGHMAVKLAHSLGAHVVVFTTSRGKFRDARRLGADEVVLSNDGSAMARQADRFDFIIDTVSAPHDLNAFLALLGVGGTLVIVGLPVQPYTVMPNSLIRGHRTLAGSGIGGIRETQEMLDYCARHGITSDIELIPIQRIGEAYERTLKSDVKYRFVIDISSLKK